MALPGIAGLVPDPPWPYVVCGGFIKQDLNGDGCPDEINFARPRDKTCNQDSLSEVVLSKKISGGCYSDRRIQGDFLSRKGTNVYSVSAHDLAAPLL